MIPATVVPFFISFLFIFFNSTEGTSAVLLISSKNSLCKCDRILNQVDDLWNLLPQLWSGINSPLLATVWVSAALHHKLFVTVPNLILMDSPFSLCVCYSGGHVAGMVVPVFF